MAMERSSKVPSAPLRPRITTSWFSPSSRSSDIPSLTVTRRAPPGASNRLETWVSPAPCQRSRAISSPTTSSPSSRDTCGAQRGSTRAETLSAASGSFSGTA